MLVGALLDISSLSILKGYKMLFRRKYIDINE